MIGFVRDNDLSTLLGLFPKDADYYFTQPSNARALLAAELCSLAEGFGLIGSEYSNVNEALKTAIGDSEADDAIYVGGSTFVVADLIDL